MECKTIDLVSATVAVCSDVMTHVNMVREDTMERGKRFNETEYFIGNEFLRLPGGNKKT